MQQHDTILWFKNMKGIWAWLIEIVKALVEDLDLIILIYLKISSSMANVSSDYSHYQKHLSVLNNQSNIPLASSS